MTSSRSVPPVVWSGPFFGATGQAEQARTAVLALDRVGVTVRADPSIWTRWLTRVRPDRAQRIEELVALDWPDGHVHVMDFAPERFYAHPRATVHVGRQPWETETAPADLVLRCSQLDELWVLSSFNRECFARGGMDEAKIQVIPEAIDEEVFRPGVRPLELRRAHGFIFLAVFAWGRRKGWDLLVRAYLDEFRADEDVTLVLKVAGHGRDAAPILRELDYVIRVELGRDPRRSARIVVLDNDPGGEGMPALYAAADAYVLPSHGEGWGRPYMEAMAMGLPTIGTRWSGNLDFMDDDNSYLIDCTLAPVPPAAWRELRAWRHHRWAEPSVEHLRELMRRVFEAPEEAKVKGARARRDIVAKFGLEPAGRVMARRLEALEPLSRQRGLSPPRAALAHPDAACEAAYRAAVEKASAGRKVEAIESFARAIVASGPSRMLDSARVASQTALAHELVGTGWSEAAACLAHAAVSVVGDSPAYAALAEALRALGLEVAAARAEECARSANPSRT